MRASDRRGHYVRKRRSPHAAQRRGRIRGGNESARGGFRRPVRRPAIRSAGSVHLRPFQVAGPRPGAWSLHCPAPSGARRPAEDQLRGVGEDPLSRRLRPVRQWPGPVSGDVLPSRPVLPEGGQNACRRGRHGAPDHLRAVLFRHAGQFAGARSAEGRRLCRPARPGSARRRARLAQERLGRLPRRGLFPRHWRAQAIRPLLARRRARRRGRRSAGRVSRLHRLLHRLGPGRRHDDALRADGGPLDRRRVPLPDDPQARAW